MANSFKKDFPIFNAPENKGLIYFDNAATAQRPACVLDAVSNFYAHNNANPLRGLYDLSSRATEDYENSRHTVAEFLNAKDCEIVFTRNASESLNLIAYTYGLANINPGDEIVVSVAEHHSNILPWQMVCRAKDAKLVFLEPDKVSGEIPESEFSKITEKTKIVAVAQVSNVLGIENPVKKIAALAHKVGAVCVVDGAQSVPHLKVDVKALDADFFVFSGHKLCGPMGIGVLYGKKALLEEMPPFLRGGEMIEYVTREDATWAELPHKFEAGTVNASGAVGLAAAIKYISSIGFEKIEKHCNHLASVLVEKMKQNPYIKIVGNPDPEKHCGIITFTVEGVHPHDVASLLDTEKIAIRAGHHCAQPLGAYLGVPATARASMYFYNDEDEVERFYSVLCNIRRMSGYKD